MIRQFPKQSNSIDCGLHVIKNVEMLYQRCFSPFQRTVSFDNRHPQLSTSVTNELKVASFIGEVINNPSPYSQSDIKMERKSILTLIER